MPDRILSTSKSAGLGVQGRATWTETGEDTRRALGDKQGCASARGVVLGKGPVATFVESCPVHIGSGASYGRIA